MVRRGGVPANQIEIARAPAEANRAGRARGLARFLPVWQGVERPRRGLDGLLDVVEQLQGVPLLASDLDELILPAGCSDYQVSDLDELTAAGEIVWRGVESVGANDGRVALYLADNVPLLAPAPSRSTSLSRGESSNC